MIFQFNNWGEFIFHLWHMNDIFSYLSNLNNCWLKKKKSMHIQLNKSEKVKLNWIFHNEFIYSFFFFFCNKTKCKNDIWTNELVILFNFYKRIKKKIQIHKSFNVIFNYFSSLYNDISNYLRISPAYTK